MRKGGNEKMKQMMMVCGALCALTASQAVAGLYGDTPDAKHAWAVHDMNRPNPVKVTAEPGKPPSDAVILFDGSEASFANWCADNGQPTKWKLVNGTLESVARAGYIRTKQSFGDCQLHIEWASPTKVEGRGQGRGNSGVFLMGNYEIQVLDSYETDPAKPGLNPNYADGQASSVYAENPPMVNACRKPGEWQTYDIVFHQPVWEGNVMKHPGSVTVFHNGVLTQDHWEMEGLTTHCRRRPLAPHAKKLPLKLQDHGNPVHFRNIWIREIPSRYANTTHGGPAACEKDVMALRHATAEKLLAKVNTKSEDRVGTLHGLLEVMSYEKSDKVMGIVQPIVAAYLDDLAKCDEQKIVARRGEIISLRNACNVLYRNKVVGDECKLRNGLQALISKYNLEKRR